MITEGSRLRAGSCTLYRSRPVSELFLRNILYESHKTILIMYRPIEASTSLPSPRPRAYPRHLAPLPSRGGGNLIIRIFKEVGNLIPVCLIRGGEFELHPRFHVESLARWAFMGDAVLDDFRGKDCAFVANWLQGLCRIWRYLNFNIFNIGFRLWIYECIKLCLQWNTIPILAIQYNNKKLNRGQLLWPATCMLINNLSDDACQWICHDAVISIGGIFF